MCPQNLALVAVGYAAQKREHHQNAPAKTSDVIEDRRLRNSALLAYRSRLLFLDVFDVFDVFDVLDVLDVLDVHTGVFVV